MSSVVQELRRARRVRRLGDLEWFEVAYRVYLAALVGGGVVIWLSGLVTDTPVTPAELADVVEYGPAVLGGALAVAVALGLRSGSDGGPVSVEAPDVRHLLLAPIPRRTVLARPVVQRLRTVAFGGALAGGIAGQLAARRLPGSAAAWAASGAVFGAVTGAAFVAVAVLVHVGRVPRWSATTLAVLVLAAQGAAIAGWITGPFDSGLALWGMRQEPTDLIGVAVIVALAVAAVVVAGRLRVEALVRRADLVSQLHFAVTMQDLRTVVLLRRQLRGERPRNRPYVASRPPRATPSAAGAVRHRGWRGLLRYPVARLVRMGVLVVAAGVAVVAVLRGTTPALVGVGVALYLLGLDAVEPLSQEIDHPDHTDALPRPRGWLLAHHLAAPAVALVPFALLGAATVTVAEPEAWAAALALCLPITWIGVGGAVVSIVRDAPDPLAPPVASSVAVPPEFAGFTSTLRLLWPIAVSTIAGLLVLGVRELPTVGTVLRMLVASVLVSVAIVWWVRRRDDWRAKWRHVLDEGRKATGATMTAFPGHAGRCWTLARWRSLARISDMVDPVSALAVAGLTKTYGDAPAVGPVDLDVGLGQRVVLLGHNGSGKTTLLRMAAGLLEATAGTIAVLGHDVGSLESRAATSYLGDQPVFYDDLSVWEHLEYIARVHGTGDWETHATELLELVGLAERADDLPSTFSRGLRQKAAIALAFVRPFELLLVDEPFVGLDRAGRDALLELFRRAHRDGAALLVATHELTTVAEAERVVALRDGAVVFDGGPTDADIDALVAK